MEWVKNKIEQIKVQIKNLYSKYDKKNVQRVGIAAVVIVALAIAAAYFLNASSYDVLFSAVPEQEAANITARLQSDGIEYQHTAAGDILVPKDIADQTRATLVIEGYPSSGFAYETYLENAGGMTTSSQEDEYKRIAQEQKIEATIGLFEGVKNAVVNISLSEDNKYVLQDDTSQNTSSASVVVELMQGARLSDDQVEGIQRLVSASVQGLEMDKVVVVDGSGIELSENGSSSSSNSEDAQAERRAMENELEASIVNLLSQFYGEDNVRVSVTGVLNQDKGISESITYTVPDGLIEEDGKGILSNESGEVSLNGEGLVGGVAGAEANAEIPQYNIGEDGEITGYNEAYIRDYLVNQTTEQKEVSHNVLEDIRVAVSLNSSSAPADLNQTDLLALVGNAAGIDSLERQERITVVSAPFYDGDSGFVPTGIDALFSSLTTTQLLIIAAAAFFIILLLILTILSSNKKKKVRLAEAAAALEAEKVSLELSLEQEKAMQIEEFNLQNEKSNEVRQSIREFAEENPEISAQMIKSWLNG